MTNQLAHTLAARINEVLKGKRPSVAVVVKDENHFFNWIIHIKKYEQYSPFRPLLPDND